MFGQRLKVARKKAGLSMDELAIKLSPPVSKQAISKYENNKMMPKSSVLMGLSRALGVPLEFLLSSQVEELVDVQFRKHSRSTAKDRAAVEVAVTHRLEDYLRIEDILEFNDEEDPFAEIRCDDLENIEQVEEKAQELRNLWELGNDAIPSMTSLLEEKGIKVIEVDLPDRVDGLACEVKRAGERDDTQVVVISSNTGIERKRFNLAHELAHRVITDTNIPDLPLEKVMHRFGAAFLVPADHLRKEVGEKRRELTYRELMSLKRFYGISAAAMLIRLKDIGVLPAGVVDYAFRTYARPWRKEEPEPLKCNVGLSWFEKPKRFENLVLRALAEDLISPVRAAKFLGKPLSDVEAMIRGPKSE